MQFDPRLGRSAGGPVGPEPTSVLALLASVEEPVLVVDAESRVAVASRAAERLFGLLPGGLQRAYWGQSRSQSREHAPAPGTESPRLEIDGRAYRIRRLDRPDPPEDLAQGGRAPAPRDDPRPGLAERAMEERCRVLEDEVDRLRAVEEIAVASGGLAHDLNNLLTVVLGSAEVGSTIASCAESSALFATIEDAARRAADLTGRLLERGRRCGLRVIDLELGRLVLGLRGILRCLVPDHVALDLPAGAPAWVRGDPGQLEQLLVNLCVNAGDAIGSAAGRIRVTVDTRSEGARRWAVLRVEDDGPGISPAVRERLFEPLVTARSAGSGTRAGTGTGLGLATVRAVAERHGGSVSAESAPDRGTRFEVRIPALPRDPAPEI